MPSLSVLKEIKTAVSKLNPSDIERDSAKRLAIGLVASDDAYMDMEDFLAPPHLSHNKRQQVLEMLYRSNDPEKPPRFDIVLYEQGLPCPRNAFTFFRDDPHMTVEEILAERPELHIPLARNFHPFRQRVVDRIVHRVARENALFAVVTALPDVIPNLFELPWSVAEFASDTAFLTINQIRMAFLIAAASDKKVGYSSQKAEIASIVTGAFGWRAIARELVGKIPLGGGLIPKGAVAYAGTLLVGQGLDRFNRIGYRYTRAERRENYKAAYDRGKGIVEGLLHGLRRRTAA